MGALCSALLLGCGSGDDGNGGGGLGVAQLPAGWLRWPVESGGNGHAYGIDRTATDWVSAEVAAQARGAYLVTITSAAEQQFVASTFLVGADLLKVFWMGCTDQAVEDTFAWVTAEPFSYTNWKSGEPNGWDGEGEDYCCINWNAVRGPIGEWNDALVAGTVGYDDGANDGPYAAILESDTSPTR
jgi:hypothetical protein